MRSDILYHRSRIHAWSQVCWNCCTPSACPIVFLGVTILHTVVVTHPSQSALSEQRVHTGRLKQYRASALDICSFHDVPRIQRMLLRWSVELLSILSCLEYIAVIQQCTGIIDCHILSSSTAQSLPTLESLDKHERLALLAEPNYVN